MTANTDEKAILNCYVDTNQRITIVCPECGYKRTMDVSDKVPTGRVVNAKCRCGRRFGLKIDFRRLYRKKVNLTGHFFDLTNGRSGDIVVKDISKGGVGFSYHGSPKLRINDYLELHFQLDDAKNSHIKKRVTVKSIQKDFIGTQFEDAGGYDTNLGFYLMP